MADPLDEVTVAERMRRLREERGATIWNTPGGPIGTEPVEQWAVPGLGEFDGYGEDAYALAVNAAWKAAGLD